MSLQENYLETWYQTYAIEKYDCKGNEVVADTFWCKWMGQLTGSKLSIWEFFQNSDRKKQMIIQIFEICCGYVLVQMVGAIKVHIF